MSEELLQLLALLVYLELRAALAKHGVGDRRAGRPHDADREDL